jgi:hypothetical protein
MIHLIGAIQALSMAGLLMLRGYHGLKPCLTYKLSLKMTPSGF